MDKKEILLWSTTQVQSPDANDVHLQAQGNIIRKGERKGKYDLLFTSFKQVSKREKAAITN